MTAIQTAVMSTTQCAASIYVRPPLYPDSILNAATISALATIL